MRTRSIGLAAAVVVLLGSSSSWAQLRITAQGILLNGEGNPVPDVEVVLQYKGHIPQSYKTKTNKKGEFLYVNAYSGPYDITFKTEDQGEVTVKDVVLRELQGIEKPPVFRLGAKKAALPPPPPGAEVSSTSSLEGEGEEGGLDADAFVAELNQALQKLEAGDHEAALNELLALEKKAPHLPQIHHNLGLAYKKMGDVAAAEAAFRKAIELNPGFKESLRSLAVLLFENGKRDEGVELAKKATEAAPGDGGLWYNLGYMASACGKTDEARQAFLKAEELTPDNPEIQFQLGTLAVGADQTDEAVARLERYLETGGDAAPNAATAKALVDALKE